MRTEIIAVGTELLLGEIVNTDAPMIAQGLPKTGKKPRVKQPWESKQSPSS